MKVLLADDSPVARYALLRELRKAGIEPACVGSVAEALAIDGTGLSCALLDLDLGDDKGTVVAAHLRRGRPDVPIAFFTSSRETVEAEAFGPVFTKPDELDRAIDWVRARLQRA